MGLIGALRIDLYSKQEPDIALVRNCKENGGKGETCDSGNTNGKSPCPQCTKSCICEKVTTTASSRRRMQGRASPTWRRRLKPRTTLHLVTFDEEPALSQYDEEPSQESTSLGAEPAMSFATSFTSFSQSLTGSKRTRPFRSPPQPSKKHGSAKKTRKSAPRLTMGSSARGLTSPGSVVLQPALAEEYGT
jgi:hypothetical protein